MLSTVQCGGKDLRNVIQVRDGPKVEKVVWVQINFLSWPKGVTRADFKQDDVHPLLQRYAYMQVNIAWIGSIVGNC